MNNLDKAADVIQSGWCVGVLHKGLDQETGDRYCAVGALAKVIAGTAEESKDFDAYEFVRNTPEGKILAEVIMDSAWAKNSSEYRRNQLERGHYDDIIYEFNDDQDDKKAVINVMRKAAIEFDKSL